MFCNVMHQSFCAPGMKWECQLVFRSKLTMHTAYDRRDNTEPASVTALAISKLVMEEVLRHHNCKKYIIIQFIIVLLFNSDICKVYLNSCKVHIFNFNLLLLFSFRFHGCKSICFICYMLLLYSCK